MIPGSMEHGDAWISGSKAVNSPIADVSVVIPTHNRTELLAETVASVLAQSVRPREIIIVDNGTEGRARQALARFGGDVTLIASPPNAKQVARNNGIRFASSTWIATLDDDDLWQPDYLAVAQQAITDGRADIIGVDHRKFRGDQADALTNFEMAPPGYWDRIRDTNGSEDWSFIGRFPRDRLLRRVPFYPSSILFRRALALDLGGFDPAMKGIMAEDLEFLIRLLGAGEVAVVWRPLMSYRLHPGNDTASKAGQEIGRWRIFEFARSFHSDLDPAFCRAIDTDLPARRRRIFDLAYGIGDYAALAAASATLAYSDWTLKRCLRSLLSRLPRPAGEAARKAIMRVTGRGHQLSA